MKRTLFINARIILEKSITEPCALLVEDKKITQIVPGVSAHFPYDTQVIDLEGRYLSAGFIDIHTHGAGGWDFTDGELNAFLGAAEHYVCFGTTSVYPTAAACPDEELRDMCLLFEDALTQNSNGANLLGIHLEGPYFSQGQRGAQNSKYIVNPTPEHYKKILSYSPWIKRWSIAPELPGALELGRHLTNQGIIAAIAHTEANYQQTLEAMNNGYSLVTHLYSGMPVVHRIGPFRHEGTVEAAYLIDDLAVEVIADGCHLPPALLKLIYKIKGPDKIVLVTDSIRAAGQTSGESITGSKKHGVPVIIEDSVAKLPDRTSFAGSVATGDRLVRTMKNTAEVPLIDAIKMFTLTPARIMGIDGKKGSVCPGKDADLTVFDEDINIFLTMVGGRIVYHAG